MGESKNLRIHFFRHVPFESPAFIGDWASVNSYTVTETKFYDGTGMPPVNSTDWLVIMGGPMNVYEYDKYPWLKDEKDYIEKAVKTGKRVIGICLGAQMIADVLGAGVYKANGRESGFKEIGWFPVRFLKADDPLFPAVELPGECTVFHWHGDTFGLPTGAVRFAESEGCKNEAFIYEDKVLALQFHMEMGKGNIRNIIENCSEDIKPGRYVQTPKEMLRNADIYQKDAKDILYKLLDRFKDS